MTNPQITTELGDYLTSQERAILSALLSEPNAAQKWNLLIESFGDPTQESPYWEYHYPKHPLNILQLKGLIAVGRVNKQDIYAVIPLELQPILAQIMLRQFPMKPQNAKRTGTHPSALHFGIKSRLRL